MNVDLLTMDKAEAMERLEAYRAALRRTADEEYFAVAAGLEAMAQGYPVINYARAIADGGVDEKGRPRLAVARADRSQVEVDRNRDWVEFSALARGASHWQYSSAFPDGLLLRRMAMPRESFVGPYRATGYALVPLVPPELILAIGGHSRLRGYLTLWEVEEWADRRIEAEPDIDPYLLRPIHGDMCAVIGQWDLTELERAVMAGRAVIR